MGTSSHWAFEALTPLGFRVHVTEHYWQIITTVKHPVMAGKTTIVQTVLESLDEIRLSRTDPSVYLFYRKEGESRWICAVIKREDGMGFLITTYPTDAIKEGERIWHR